MEQVTKKATNLETDPVDMAQVDKNNATIIRHMQKASGNVRLTFLKPSVYDNKKRQEVEKPMIIYNMGLLRNYSKY